MPVVTVTARGQVTFRKSVLQHLGIEPGGKLEVELLPGGKAALHAPRPEGSVDEFVGLLAGRQPKVATLEEMHQAAAEGWAGER